jgi:hypothetical protein
MSCLDVGCGGNVEFRLADVSSGPREAEFDLIYVRFLLTHLPGRRLRRKHAHRHAARLSDLGPPPLRQFASPSIRLVRNLGQKCILFSISQIYICLNQESL